MIQGTYMFVIQDTFIYVYDTRFVCIYWLHTLSMLLIYYKTCCVWLISKWNSAMYLSLFSFRECFGELLVEH